MNCKHCNREIQYYVLEDKELYCPLCYVTIKEQTLRFEILRTFQYKPAGNNLSLQSIMRGEQEVFINERRQEQKRRYEQKRKGKRVGYFQDYYIKNHYPRLKEAETINLFEQKIITG